MKKLKGKAEIHYDMGGYYIAYTGQGNKQIDKIIMSGRNTVKLFETRKQAEQAMQELCKIVNLQ